MMRNTLLHITQLYSLYVHACLCVRVCGGSTYSFCRDCLSNVIKLKKGIYIILLQFYWQRGRKRWSVEWVRWVSCCSVKFNFRYLLDFYLHGRICVREGEIAKTQCKLIKLKASVAFHINRTRKRIIYQTRTMCIIWYTHTHTHIQSIFKAVHFRWFGSFPPAMIGVLW